MKANMNLNVEGGGEPGVYGKLQKFRITFF